MRLSILSFAAPILLIGCNGPGSDKDNSNDTGPAGGDSDEPVVNYDEGCIALDSGQTFAWLSDALTVADSGATIDLSGCGDTFEQTAEVTQSVTITGGGLTWNAPVNESALTVTGAADVTVSGFTLTSTRNGLMVDSSSNVTFDDIVFASVANTAIKSTDSSITVSNSTFTAPEYGGLDISGGTASVVGNAFDAPIGFAVRTTDGAVATVTDNTLNDCIYTDASEGISDGFALFGDDGSFVTENNTFSNNIVAIFTNQGDITMTGDVIEGGLYGVYGQLGAFDIDGVTVTTPQTQGMYLVAQDDAISLTNSTIYGDPDLTYYTADSTAWTGGAVTLASDAGITVEGVDIEGFNAQGLLAVGYSDVTDVAMTDVTITNTGRYGLWLQDVDAVMSNVMVDTVRLVDDPAEVNQDYTYSVGYGVMVYEADVQWTGGGILDSEVIGMVAQYSSVTLDTVELGGHTDLGVWGIYSTLDVSNSTISMSPALGGVANYYGDAVITDNTFVDNLATDFYEYDSTSWTYLRTGTTGDFTSGTTTFTDENAEFVTWGLNVGDAISSSANGSWNYVASVDSETQLTMDYAWSATAEDTLYYIYQGTPRTYGYEYSNQSQDLVCSGGTSMEITGNTFTNGSQSVWFSGCEGAVVEDNSWDGYANGYVLQFSSTTDTAKVKNNTIANTGPFPVYCYNSVVDIEGLSIDNATASSTDITYYTDGEETGSYTSSYSGEAVYASGCTLTLDDVQFTDTAYNAIYASESTLELFDVSVSGGSDLTSEYHGTIAATWSSSDPYLLIDGLSIDGPSAGIGLGISVADGLGSGTVSMDGVVVSDVADDALSAAGVTGTLSNSSLTASGTGLWSSGSDLTLETVTLSSNVGWGYAASDLDGDGYSAGGGDCDDTNAAVNPGAAETVNSIDDDCDGYADDGTSTADSDGDGYEIADGDCDDTDNTRYPGAAEATAGVDSDCDGFGFVANQSSLDATGLTVTGNGGGLLLDDLATVVLDGSTVSGNTSAGLECSDSTGWSSCSSNSIDSYGDCWFCQPN